jgi:hypothetical protein
MSTDVSEEYVASIQAKLGTCFHADFVFALFNPEDGGTYSFETSDDIQQTVRRCITEGRTLQIKKGLLDIHRAWGK